jgi:hypothetical protein
MTTSLSLAVTAGLMMTEYSRNREKASCNPCRRNGVPHRGISIFGI